MSDDHKDVLIAAYLFEDLAENDFDAVLKAGLYESAGMAPVLGWVMYEKELGDAA